MHCFSSHHYGQVTVVKLTYGNGTLAVQLVSTSDGEDIATLSVNLPAYAYHLKANEFFAKTWSENTEIARKSLKSGVVVDTGGRVDTEIGPVPIWRCR